MPTATAPALAVTEVGHRFGERWALRGVSFEVAPRETVAIIGPNGAGKTTLVSIIGGALQPTEGSVSRPPRDIGWVPQQSAVYGKLTVRENLALFARLERLPDPDAAVERMLDQTGLRDRADDEVGELSGGGRQRVNIAVGLLSDPDVVLLDEPSASLDPRQRARLWEFVGTLARSGAAVLFTTHDIAEAERYADRVLVLADGELLFQGTPRELHAAVDDDAADIETAFVRFLASRGH